MKVLKYDLYHILYVNYDCFFRPEILKMEIIYGSCHCKKVKWSFNLPLTTIVQCHCQNCRKMQGGDYSTWIAVPDRQFSVLTGEVAISHYQFNDRSSKSFCPSCGTVVYGINGKHFEGHKLVSLGTVDKYLPELKPQLQVYTEHRSEWGEIQSDVPIMAKN